MLNKLATAVFAEFPLCRNVQGLYFLLYNIFSISGVSILLNQSVCLADHRACSLLRATRSALTKKK